jgi:DNA-binding Lrp family transcriptional regulator
LNPLALGLGFSAVVFVTMRDGNQENINHFEAAVIDIPQIIEAKRLFGDPDYMLQIVVKDLEAYQVLYDRQLSAMPGVQRLTSTLVMKNLVQNRELPL